MPRIGRCGPSFITPPHGLEGLHFDEAVKRGTQLFDGQDYLSNKTFCQYFKSGRIRPEDLLRTARSISTTA